MANRETAAVRIGKTIASFQRHGCGSLDYFSPRRMAEQSARISQAAAAFAEALSEADERTILDFGIIGHQFDPDLDYVTTANVLANIAKKAAVKHKVLERKSTLSATNRSGRGRPRSPGLGDEGLPAHVWFIKDMARLARALGGRFPADKNDKCSVKWERLRGLLDPLLPKGFFKGLTNGSRSAIVQEAIVTEKKYRNIDDLLSVACDGPRRISEVVRDG